MLSYWYTGTYSNGIFSGQMQNNSSCWIMYPNLGCTDSTAINYDSTATHDNGSCIYYFGCIDPNATNYNPWANVDDGTCIMDVACNDSIETLLDVAIKLDNWPGETSWQITANGNVIYSVPSGTYNYTQTGQTIHTQVCAPIGDTLVFTIDDTYGDGIGGGSVVGGCLVTNVDLSLIHI